MELSRDDERARRICSLALEFMSARAPVGSADIARAHYPDLSADSFRRAWARDREALAACGVVVTERPVPGGASAWEVDETRSFAGGAELSPLEAAALEAACRPLLDQGDFPLAGELRLALAKLSRAFAVSDGVPASPTEPESAAARALRSCLAAGHAAEAVYVDARGRRSERALAPYGLFCLRGATYLVAGRLDGDGRAVEGGTRTYRLDRFERARELPKVSVRPPADFSVADWRRLPFQMGPVSTEGVFEVPDDREADVRRAAGAQGRFSREGGALVWRVPVSDERAAASWAVAMGVAPVGPDGLVSSWRDLLEGVLAHG